MKKINQFNLEQQSKILKLIENELRSFMKDEHIQIYFNNIQNNRQIREHVKKIAKNTIFDDSGAVLIEESLMA